MNSDEPVVAEARLPATVSVADEVWVATALLHREQPERESFSAREISERARREAITPTHRAGVYVHAIQHCVANRPPNPGRRRVLFATSRSQRRLFRPGDPCHPLRADAPALPEVGNLPPRYRALLDWYATAYATARAGKAAPSDPLLELARLGRELWRDEAADAYVDRLRRGWK